MSVKARLIKRQVERAQKDFDKAALENPEGCRCEFCAELLPWDAHVIYKHSLRHPEMYEKKKKLSEANERKLREWRLSEIERLEGET